MIYPDFPLPEPVDNGELSPEEQLAKYSGQVPWSYLAPYCENDCLFYVDPSLDLKFVGTAFATDQAASVKAWLKSGEVVRMGAIHGEQWKDSGKEFDAVLVSPFVLCRPLP